MYNTVYSALPWNDYPDLLLENKHYLWEIPSDRGFGIPCYVTAQNHRLSDGDRFRSRPLHDDGFRCNEVSV